MNSFLLATTIGESVIVTLMAVILAAIAVLSIVAFVYRLTYIFRYHKYNTQPNNSDLTARESAEYFLKVAGLEHIKVKQCGFFRFIFLGEGYSYLRKTVFLRRLIINKKSITAVSVACKYVGFAIQDNEGDKKFRFIAKMRIFSYIAPFAFLPIALVGLFIDLVFLQNGIAIGTIITSSIALVYFLLSFLVVLFSIGVEKKSSKRAIAVMREHKVLVEEDLVKVEDMFEILIKAQVIDFVINVLYIIWYILKIVLKAVQKKK